MPTVYQAIETKYLCPTNTRGARIKATCARASLTVPYPHDLDESERHAYAAAQLVAKFVAIDAKLYGTPAEKNPWNRPRVIGCLPTGAYAHVYLPEVIA